MPASPSSQNAGGGGLPPEYPKAPEPARNPAATKRAASNDMPVGVAVTTEGGKGGTVTARKAGGLRDLGLNVDPRKAGVKEALQHLAKAVNIAFQTDYGENYLETIYQAAIVRRGEVNIIHKEYFGFGDSWFGEFGRFIRSLELTLEGPDPASPEGQERIKEKGPSSIRGILNLIGRKLDIVAEYEDRVPAYVEQMFDRLEASGIVVGWNRNDWDIWTTQIGLDIRMAPRKPAAERPEAPAIEIDKADPKSDASYPGPGGPW